MEWLSNAGAGVGVGEEDMLGALGGRSENSDGDGAMKDRY